MYASHLKEAFDKKTQEYSLRWIKNTIKEREIEFDGFVVTGLSGVILGSILARSMKKELVVVRKAMDNSHSPYTVENYKPASTYIFLDDFIATGETLKHVKRSLNEAYNGVKKWAGPVGKHKILGSLLYSDFKYIKN